MSINAVVAGSWGKCESFHCGVLNSCICIGDANALLLVKGMLYSISSIFYFRPRRSRSVAAYSRQTFP